jgi:hypothetical protein
MPLAIGQKEMGQWMVAGTPLPLAILATLYADVAARIGRAASYIHNKLRPRLAQQTSPAALGWEQYIRQDDPNKELLRLTDKVRYFIFFFPAIFTYVLSFWLRVSLGWDLFFKIVNGIALLGAFIVARWSESVLKEIPSQPAN